MREAPRVPPPRVAGRLHQLTRPWVVFSTLAVLIILAALLAPRTVLRSGQERLTTKATDESGASALAEVAVRLGWPVARADTAITATDVMDARPIYAELYPPITLTAGDVHRLLDAVRRGAGLLTVLRPGSALAESLHVAPRSPGGTLEPDAGDVAGCPPSRKVFGITWFDDSVHLYQLRATAPLPDDTVWFGRVVAPLSFRDIQRARQADSSRRRSHGADTAAADTAAADTAAADTSAADRSNAESGGADSGGVDATITMTTTTASGHGDTSVTAADELRARALRLRGRRAQPAALGMPLGRGRVVAIADPDLLRNDVLRVCRWGTGVLAVRMLEYLTPEGGTRPLLFDEYHQGFGVHASTMRAVAHALVRTPPGRVVLMGLVAALLLLYAMAPRPLVPTPRPRIERRSPLEHVGALARAYEQVGATRLATRRLVHGLRRRHAHGAWSRGSDDEFLDAIAARHPALAPQVQLLRNAARARVAPSDFLAVGQALTHIERTLAP